MMQLEDDFQNPISDQTAGRKPLVIITGPTSIGKTSVSVDVASRLGGEIISADSMQVYKKMDIGTAKIKPSEMKGVPHHLIDILEPDESYNVALFNEMVNESLNQIYQKNVLPIIAGGTGFYIQSILYDIDFTNGDEDIEYRLELEKYFNNGNGSIVYEMLKETDPRAASKIHPNDSRRIIRALEFYKTSGKRISEHNSSERSKVSPYNFLYFVLTDDRDRIYNNINKRVDLMIEEGLLEEVKALYSNKAFKSSTSLQAIGYKEIISYLENETTLEGAIEKIKQNTRHYAKRQLTWFKRERDVIWVDKKAFDYNNSLIADFITDKIRSNNLI